MISVTRAFSQRTTDVAREFLRSAVVFDDELSTADPQPITAPQENLEAALADPTLEGLPPVETPTAVELAAASKGRVDVDRIVRGFADVGIVCAALLADSDVGRERVIRVSKRADLVVLDWDVREDHGDSALEVIRVLRDADGLRLVAIYTQSPNVDEIVRKLKALNPPPVLTDHRASLGSLSVVIFLKPSSGVRRGPESTWVVSEDDLPTRLVEEFSSVSSGLLANAALRGMAAVRRKTPLVLAALDSSLDPGYLAHRFLLDDPGDAEEHAEMLVASELTAALATAGIEEEVGMEAISAWLDEQPFTKPDFPADRWGKVFRDPRPSARIEAIVKTLALGLRNVSFGPSADRHVRNVRALFAEDEGAGILSNDRFAHLMSIRSIHDEHPHRLDFGTLVTTDAGAYVCIQPACDAIRLEGNVAFPLIPLKRETGQGGFQLVVVDGAEARRFSLPTKFRQVQLVQFAADPTERQVVEQQLDDEWRFTDVEGIAYRWIGELRESAALRIAKRYADQLFRVGLDESEWLRRSAPRALDSDEGG